MKEAEFIQAVVRAPDDDAPRQAYATWLTARGDPRGRFIELQLEGERDGDWRKRQAAEAILAEHQAQWAPAVRGASVRWKRGFPESVFILGDDFLVGSEQLFAEAPIRELALYLPSEAALFDVARMPWLARLRRLDLGESATPAGLAALIDSPFLTGLEVLELGNSPIGDAGAVALAACGWRLRKLSLHGCGIGAEGLAALAASPVLSPTRDLNLSGNPIGEGAAALGASPHLGQLRTLVLSGADLGDAGAAALADAAALGALEILYLAKCGVGNAGATALAAGKGLPALLTLYMSENYVGDAGAAALAASTGFARLLRLDLTSNAIGEAGAEAFADGQGLPALQLLQLSHNPIYTPGVTEDWTDWDGSIVGSGPVKAAAAELNARFGRRFKID
jgi:uncharacterized protein (TIGR02996 family)